MNKSYPRNKSAIMMIDSVPPIVVAPSYGDLPGREYYIQGAHL